jgi:hypothetical protein
MRYNDNREVNEMEHRNKGEREVINSSQLMAFLGGDNYLNKAEEMLLDILNSQYPLQDAVNDVVQYYIDELKRNLEREI